jgi:hypothetical protein
MRIRQVIVNTFATSSAFSVLMSLAAVLAAIIRPDQVHAVTVNYVAVNTPVVSVIGLTGFQTYGNEMTGMTVTADFTNGSSATASWDPTSSTGGAAIGQGWALSESGDTFTSNWSLAVTDRTLQISSLTLTGFVAVAGIEVADGTVFDRTLPDQGTIGSSDGHDLSVSTAAGAWSAIDVTYRDPIVSLASGQAVQHDEYRQLQLTFGSFAASANGSVFVPAPFIFGNNLSFVQDTDTVGVPEPSSFLLGTLGLLLLVAVIGTRRFSAHRMSEGNISGAAV